MNTGRGTMGDHAELSEAEEDLVVNPADPTHDIAHSAFAVTGRIDRISS
jgi:hypothetical protein